MKPRFILSTPIATLLAAVASISSLSRCALAATTTWTGTTDANWATGPANWNGASPSSGNSLAFTSATGAGGLTLVDNLMTPGAYNVAGITFSADAPAFVINPNTVGTNGFTLTGDVTNNSANLQTINDTITLNGSRTFTTTAGGGDLTLGGLIGGSGAVTKSGAGTLTLSGSNSYTGGATITGGTLNINSDSALGGTGNLTFNGPGATLQLSGSFSTSRSYAMTQTGIIDTNGYNLTDNATISGAGGLTKTGAGTLTLSAREYYSGATTVNSGKLVITGNNAQAIGSAAVVVNNGGTFEVNGINCINQNQFTVNAGGTLNMAAGKTAWLQGGLTLNGGTLASTDAGYGGYTWVLSPNGANPTKVTVTGDTTSTISAQNMQVYEPTGSVTFDVADGASAIDLNVTGNFKEAGTSGLIKAGAGTMALAGANSYTGTTTINAGTLQIGNGTTDGSIASSSGIANNAALVYNLIGSGTYANGISGTGTVTKSGTGTLTLAGANSYTGATTISAGTLQLGNSGTTGSLSTSSAIIDNGILKFNRTDTVIQGTDFSAGAISGTGGLAQSGSGTTILTGSNTYGGTTTVGAGTLQANHASALGNGGSITFGGGTLQYTNASAGQDWSTRFKNSASAISLDTNGQNVTLAGFIDSSNSGGLKKSGTGTLTLSGSNSYTGGTTITGGTLNINSDSALGSAGNLTFSGPGATLQLSASGSTSRSYVMTQTGIIDTNGYNLTVSIGISGNGGLTKTGAGTLTLSSRSNQYGVTTINGGTLQANGANGGTSTLGNSSAIVVNNGGTISFSTDNSLVGYNTAGSKTITINAGGVIATTANTSSHLNALVLNGGTLSAIASQADFGTWNFDYGVSTSGSGTTSYISGGNAALTQTGGSVFNIGAGDTVLVFTILAHTNYNSDNGLIKQGAGTLTLTGSNSYTSVTTINAGTLQIGDGTTDGSIAAAGSILDNASLTFNGARFQTCGNAISGTGTLTKTGAGTLTLSGSNSYSGGTIVSSGVLSISSTSALPGWNAGTKYSVASGAGLAVGNNLNDDSVATFIGTGNFVAGSLFGFDTSAADRTYTSDIVWSNLGLVKAGSNTLTLTGSSSYGGPTGIFGGKLNLGSANALPASGNIVFSGGALQYSGSNQVDISGRIAGSTGAIAIDTNGQNIVFASGIASLNTGGLTKSATGTLTLSGSNAYTGTTTMSGGILQANHASALGNGGSITFGGGTLQYTSASAGQDWSTRFKNSASAISLDPNGQNVTLAGSIDGSNSGGLTKTGAGTLTLSGSNAYTGTTTMSGGILQANHASALGNGGNIAFGGGTLQYTSASAGQDWSARFKNSASAISLDTNGQNVTLAGSIDSSNSGGLKIAGASTLTLSGSNAYTGTTTIGSGTLQANHASALGNGGSITFGGGTLQYTGASAGQDWSWRFKNSASAIGLDTNGQNVSLGAIDSSNSGGLTKTGAGTLTLSANCTYSGTTTVNGGTLQTSAGNTSTGAIGYSSAIVVNNGGTISVGGANSFVGGAHSTITINAGGVITDSNTIASTNHLYSVVLNGGTLSASNSNSWYGTWNFDNGISTPGNGASSYISGGNAALSQSGGTVFNIGATDTVLVSTNLAHCNGAGDNGLIKSGSGTLTLTGYNSYTGATTVNSGTLQIGDGMNGTMSATTVTVNANATLALNLANSGTFSSGIFNYGTVNLNTGGTSTIVGNIGGWVGTSINQNGTGTTILSGNNDYIGTTNINEGTLQLAQQYAAYKTTVNLNVANGLAFSASATAVTLGGLSGTSDIALVTTSGSGVALTVGNNNFDSTFSGAISGSNGSLIKSGSGTLTLTGSNSYTNGTTITGGTLKINSDFALGSVGNLTFNGPGATLQLGGSGSTSRNFGMSQTGIIDTNGYNLTVSNWIGGTGGLTKTGAGTLTLSSNSNQYGVTTVNGGTLQVNGANGGSSTLGNSSAIVVNNGGTISVSTASDNSLVGWSVSSKTITINAGGVITNAGTTTNHLNALVLNGGTLSASASNALYGTWDFDRGVSTSGSGTTSYISGGNAALCQTGGSVFNIGAGDTVLVSTILAHTSSSDAGLIKTGAGTMVLGGSNSYMGGTTVNNGTLQLGNASALGTGVLSVNGGTLDLHGNSIRVLAFSGSGGSVSNMASGTSTLTTTVASGTSTYAGNIVNGTGSVVLTNSGAGTLLLSGSLNMAGLNANGGVTQLTQSGSIGAVSVASGATLSMAAHSGSTYNVLSISSLMLSGSTSGFVAANNTTPSTVAPALLNADFVGSNTSMLTAAGQTAVANASAAEPDSPEAVPEPGALGLLFTGALGLFGFRCKGKGQHRA